MIRYRGVDRMSVRARERMRPVSRWITGLAIPATFTIAR